MILEERLRQVSPLNRDAMEQAGKRWDQVAKPLHSLGLLEDAVTRIAGICGTDQVQIHKKALIIMCADNGIVEEGVTQAGQEVTAVVTENFTKGDSCVCIMAEQAGVQVIPVDIGVAGDLEKRGHRYPLHMKKIAYGTKNFYREPAMSEMEVRSAIDVGIHMVKTLKQEGYQLIATGEMGIGNTTTSSAVGAVLLGVSPESITGTGAGLSKEGLEKKIQVIGEGILLRQPNGENGLDVLAKVGGLDLAGLAGVFLGGAIYRIPVVIDGFISAVAALAAAVICPAAKDFMLASHSSAEPGSQMVLQRLGQTPLIQAGMCLGEGTGAMALMPLLDMAVEIYRRMSTFQEIQIEEYKPL